MFVTPNSAIKVLRNVPLTSNNKNTIYFDSRAEQTTYFSGLSKHSFTGCTYIKETKKVRIDKKADDLYDCNYIMYQNAGFSNKWFYAFITEVEYVNNVCCNVSFEIDEKQTWLLGLDYKIMPSFVEREHVVDDTIGFNVVDEGLEYGEYIFKDYEKSNLFTELAYIVAVSDLSPFLPEGLKASARIYDNLVSGLVYWVFRSDSITNMTAFLLAYDTAGKADAVEMIFTIPWAFLPNEGQLLSTATSNELQWNYETTHTEIDGYTPKNKKLFCYPYNVLNVSNNNGNSAQYRFEDFLNPADILFKIESHIAPNPVIVCSPRNYKKHLDFNSQVQEYCITLENYPLCSWKSDIFRNWIAQNSLSVIGGTVGGIAGTVAGVATGNVLVATGGLMSVFNQLAQVTKASIVPDQAKGNIKNGSFNIAHERQDFYIMHMTIKNQYARIIDDFLSMYGYKVNKVKVPNVNTRPHWNYVKTNGVTLVGINNDISIPADSMKKLTEMYDNGVTFWQHGSEVGNYNLNNAI